MSKLDELIKELCPDGVEYVPIKKIAKISIGEFIHKNLQNENSFYPVYNGGTSNTGFYEKFNMTANKIIISARGANAGFVNRIFTNYWAGNSCYTIDVYSQNDWNFVYYWFKTNELKLLGNQQTGSIPAISKKQVEDFKIPLPPLPVQEEIVRILDKFTELTAELTAELTNRKKQYDYYREQLYIMDKQKIEHFCLGDNKVGEFIRGSNLQKKDFTETGFPCIHYGQIYTYYGTSTIVTKSFVSDKFAKKARKASYGDLIIATTSENDEDVCKAVVWLGNSEVAVSSDACFYVHNMNPKYVGYFFQTEQFQKQKRQYITGAKVRRVNADNLAKIIIPIPSLPEQQRIVDILDRFDTLCNDISKGLPAEIKIRQQQYEYYRDKLLSFKELKPNK